MHRSIVDTYISALKQRKRVTSDDDLAKSLGIGKSTLATWRRRGAVPNEVAGDLLIDQVLDYFSVIHMHLSLVLSESPIGQAMLLQAAMRIGRDLDESGARDWSSWLAEHQNLIFDHVAKEDSKNYPEEYLTDAHIAVRMMALGGRAARNELITPEMLRSIRRDYER